MMQRKSRPSINEVKPCRGQRRVQSSSARLSSVKETPNKDSSNNEQSPFNHDIPHLSASSTSGSQDSAFSAFAKGRVDKIDSLSKPYLLKAAHSLVTRTASMSLDNNVKHSSSRTSSRRLDKGLKHSPKIATPYNLKKSQSYAPSSSTIDELHVDFDIGSMKQWAFDTKYVLSDLNNQEEDRLIVSFGSDDEDTIEIFRSDKVVREGIKACEQNNINSNHGKNHKSKNNVKNSVKNSAKNRSKKQLLIAAKKQLFTSKQESFPSDKVVTEDIKPRDKKKSNRWKDRKLKKKEKKQMINAKEKNIPKPKLVQRVTSDSSESRKTQQSQEIETRRNLIAKIRKNHSIFLGGRQRDSPSTPLAANADISTEFSTSHSSTNSDALTNKGIFRMNCFSNFVGIKPTDSDSLSFNNNNNCFNSFIGTPQKMSRYETESLSSIDTDQKRKINTANASSNSAKRADKAEGRSKASRERPTKSTSKTHRSKQKLKVAVTPTRKEEDHHFQLNPLSPTEPFDPNAIDVPYGILTSLDDDHSVGSNKSGFSFSSSHYSQSSSLPTTPSRSLASTPRYNIVQVGQTPEKLLASELDNGNISDCASACSQSSILSTSSYSSVYTDSSSIRDPCAKKSRIVQRSKKLRQLGGDGDVWIEKLFVSKKSGKKRIYFVSVKTGERVRGEPPSGASHVLYAADLVHRQGSKNSEEPETIVLCK